MFSSGGVSVVFERFLAGVLLVDFAAGSGAGSSIASGTDSSFANGFSGDICFSFLFSFFKNKVIQSSVPS